VCIDREFWPFAAGVRRPSLRESTKQSVRNHLEFHWVPPAWDQTYPVDSTHHKCTTEDSVWRDQIRVNHSIPVRLRLAVSREARPPTAHINQELRSVAATGDESLLDNAWQIPGSLARFLLRDVEAAEKRQQRYSKIRFAEQVRSFSNVSCSDVRMLLTRSRKILAHPQQALPQNSNFEFEGNRRKLIPSGFEEGL